MPDGFSSEDQLAKAIADHMVNKEVKPSLRRNWLVYESYKITKTSNKIGDWSIYHCEVTTHHEAYPNEKIVVTFMFYGEYYARHIVNGWTGIIYTKFDYYYNGTKALSKEISSDSDIDRWIDYIYPDY